MHKRIHVIRSQAEDPGASEITKDQPLGGGPSRKLNNIIGVWKDTCQVRESLSGESCSHPPEINTVD
jgi:hypothetical protein